MNRVRWPFDRVTSAVIAAVVIVVALSGVAFASAKLGPRPKTALSSPGQQGGFNSSAPFGAASTTGGTPGSTSPKASPSHQASPTTGSHAAASPSAGSTPSSGEGGGGGGGGAGPSPNPPPASGSYPRVGINIEPSIRPTRYSGPNPDGWWCTPPNCYGVSDGTSFVDTEMQLASRLGVQSVRLEFPWPLIEPTRGGFNWARADYIVGSANRYQVSLQPVLIFTPSWESTNMWDPPSAADYSAFVSTVVTRYRSSIHYWEMWNEPDNYPTGSYFNGSVAQYVNQVLVPGFNATRAADPSARVILGGPGGPNTGWLNGIYSSGGGNAFDIMAFHDYASSGGQIIGDAGSVEGVLQQHGQGAKPLWLGEYGTQENTIQDANQQTLMTSVLTGKSPIAMAQWYNIRDDFSMTSPTTIYKAAYWGLATSSYALKNGYGTMQQLIRQGY